jgi:hypothetical protein
MQYLRPTERDALLVNIMLNAMDDVLKEMWGHLSDMGMSHNAFLRLKAKVRVRL